MSNSPMSSAGPVVHREGCAIVTEVVQIPNLPDNTQCGGMPLVKVRHGLARTGGSKPTLMLHE